MVNLLVHSFLLQSLDAEGYLKKKKSIFSWKIHLRGFKGACLLSAVFRLSPPSSVITGENTVVEASTLLRTLSLTHPWQFHLTLTLHGAQSFVLRSSSSRANSTLLSVKKGTINK